MAYVVSMKRTNGLNQLLEMCTCELLFKASVIIKIVKESVIGS